MASADPASREGWFRLYLSTIVLVPVGIASLLMGALMTASPEPVSVTLVVMGLGLVVFGAFGPRMVGPFKIGPQGAEGGLSPATKQIVGEAVARRLNAAKAEGRVNSDTWPTVESWVEGTVAGALSQPSGDRRPRIYIPHKRGTADTMPAEAINRLAEALTDVAIDTLASDQGSMSK